MVEEDIEAVCNFQLSLNRGIALCGMYRGRLKLVQHDQIDRALSGGVAKGLRNQGGFMKRVMNLEEAREICINILSAYPIRELA